MHDHAEDDNHADHNHAEHGHAEHGHEQHGHEHHGSARVSTLEERALLAPFVDDLHEFLRRALDGVDGPIAEVGAGDGIIADRLRSDGFDVVAIDSHPGTAEAATAQGREVIHADWRSWDGGGHAPFAALLFTRSLHHIDPLEQAVEQMLRLAPGGLVIADEFARELVDAPGAQFLMDSWALLAAAGLRDDEPTVSVDPLGAWAHRMEVEHEVATGERILDAIRSVGEIEQMGYGRFMAQLAVFRVDPAHPQAIAVRDLLIATEDARLAAGSMAKAGLRFVARLRT